MFAGIALFLRLSAASAQTQPVEAKQPLSVLYVGGDGDYVDPERGEDFRRFLEKHFVSVKSAQDTDFTPALAKGVDIIVVDGDIIQRIPTGLRRPMVLLGAKWGPIGIPESRGYKLQDQCRVLTEKLHSLWLDHAIFRGPLPVTPTLTDEFDSVTRRYVQAWKTHEPFFISRYNSFAKGMTVSGTRLLGAEDSEVIAGGMNERGDHAVALAREANLFHWGPAASPRHMTEEAKRVFVNTIVYMKQFDGAQPTVWRSVKPRSGMAVAFNILTYESNQLENPLKGGNAGDIELQEAGIEASTNDLHRLIEATFPPQVVKRLGYDVEKYRALYEPNLGYVHVPHDTTWYTIDEEAKSIGLPNNDLRFLEKCVELLRQPAEAAKARRLLERYTGLSFPDAKAWQHWLESNRERLYFSDYYDYRFYSGPAASAPAQREVRLALSQMKMDESANAAVSVGAVAVSYGVSTPAKTLGRNMEVVDLHHEPGAYRTDKGALVTLVVRVKIADGNFTSARVSEGKPYEPTKISVELPQGARWHGEWQTPKTYDRMEPGVAEYRGDAVFTRQLYFTSVPKEGRDVFRRVPVSLRGTVRYQACFQAPHDAVRCLDPRETPFEAKIIVADN
jgi:hypothetical protein